MGLILIKTREMMFTQPAERFVHRILTRVLIPRNMLLLQPVSCLENSVRFPPVLLVQLASPTATVNSSTIKIVHWTEKYYILKQLNKPTAFKTLPSFIMLRYVL
jgi:hypothetical protein